MAFRVVLIENEVEIRIKLNNLIVQKKGDEFWVPLDDISMIVIDNLSSSITVRMLSQLAEGGIEVVICNHEHLPIGIYGSYDNHSRSTKIFRYQIEKDSQFYDQLWKKIVHQKIINQAEAYNIIKDDLSGREKIIAFSDMIENGDRTNREAHAAKVYFNLLMGTSYSRGNDDILLNSGLDYGYAIIRAYIARVCVGYGLNTQLGIHHRNEYNRFNLVDDLMEPIRPAVDILAYRLLENEKYFKPEHRRHLVNILNMKIIYNKKKMFISNMLNEYVEQVSAFMQNKREEIEFPKVKFFQVYEDGL